MDDTFRSILDKVRGALPPDLPVYLVGGAVRDLLLQKTVHDLDFTLPGDAQQPARRVADALGAAYYPLDQEHNAARVVWHAPVLGRIFLDFAGFRGDDLKSDLLARDLTINAIALDIRALDTLSDPLGGEPDLRAKRLRACSSTSFIDDPLRVMRAVRQGNALGFNLLPETLVLMRQAVGLLPRISIERVRDELFRILDGQQIAAGLRLLDHLDILPYVLPELPALKGIGQDLPHVQDAWEHTLDVVSRLETLLDVLRPAYDQEKAASLALGMVSLRLGRYREQIAVHLAFPIVPDRTVRPLLFLAALYHDIAKPLVRQIDDTGRARFFNHDEKGVLVAAARSHKLHLSNPEIERLSNIIRCHMRPLWFSNAQEPPTQRAIYRFYRETGLAGVDICLLSLADVMGTYGVTLPQDTWSRHLDIVRLLLEAWWEKNNQVVKPPVLVNGGQLIERFSIQPGPQIGYLLEAIREAQVEELVKSQEDAFALVENLLKSENSVD